MHNLISKAVESHSLNAEELLELLKNDAINPELFAIRSCLPRPIRCAKNLSEIKSCYAD